MQKIRQIKHAEDIFLFHIIITADDIKRICDNNIKYRLNEHIYLWIIIFRKQEL